jgi:hypothetical protein
LGRGDMDKPACCPILRRGCCGDWVRGIGVFGREVAQPYEYFSVVESIAVPLRKRWRRRDLLTRGDGGARGARARERRGLGQLGRVAEH